MYEPLVPLGEIVTTHGLAGWLKLNPFNRDTLALGAGAEVFLQIQGAESPFEIEASRPHRSQWLIKLKGIDSIDAAVRWVGARLSVRQADLDELGPGEYYHYQVIGFEVFSVSGKRIGTISSTLSTPAGELYVVQGSEREHLIPAVKEMIEKVDFDAGTMVINPPEGLLDL